jgi:hypothetical protein
MTNSHQQNPTLALLREGGIQPTLDDWLEFNGVEDELDAELLDVLPAEFCDEYVAGLLHNNEMNRRFEQERRQAKS